MRNSIPYVIELQQLRIFRWCNVEISSMSIISMKTLSLLILVLQNTCLVLLMRYTRTKSGPMYLASVAVTCDEAIKIIFCTCMLIITYFQVKQNGSVSGLIYFLRREIYPSSFEFFRMAVPALCYTVQKNFLYLAVSHLDAAVYQVAYQGKILTTAFFAFIILNKQLSWKQIFSLFLLLIGVSIVQLSSMQSSSTMSSSLVGVLSITIACFTSGFAAIYFEWVLKKNKEPTPHDIWTRNIQLAFFAFIIAIVGVVVKDGEAVCNAGIFYGFDWLTWLVVGLEAFGGIVVALVIKYADTILKNFATAVSIVTSTIVSFLFLGFEIKGLFIAGSMLVMFAIYLYTSPQVVTRYNQVEEEELGNIKQDTLRSR